MSEDASDKTEDPTQKRLDDAYENGNVPKSADLVSFLMLGTAAVMVNTTAGYMSQTVYNFNRNILANLFQIPLDHGGAMEVFTSIAILFGQVLAIPFAMFIVMGLVSNMMQHKVIFSLKSITPSLSKISPFSGFTRIFGKAAVMNLFKGIAKLIAVGIAVFFTLWPARIQIESLINMPPEALLFVSKKLVLDATNAALVVIGLVGAFDYIMARRKWWEGLKMSKQEIKDEYKQQEGNQEVKAKIRQMRMATIRRQIAQNVPKATVIITNPTHYAIALLYEKDMLAPKCLAKGVDTLALKIREIAEANEIPIVENPPLARALYATVDFDEEIPEEHYKAVAEIIGYVFRLRQKVKAWKAG